MGQNIGLDLLSQTGHNTSLKTSGKVHRIAFIEHIDFFVENTKTGYDTKATCSEFQERDLVSYWNSLSRKKFGLNFQLSLAICTWPQRHEWRLIHDRNDPHIKGWGKDIKSRIDHNISKSVYYY
ncbi:hypothetical protein CDAR_531641 [Caerostris darwini]|uniref:Uncharacterized protein n=1 Tax=Caerostris darwini TaxID=1538125 RepID=A0AAV4QC30_9ARAC|nr:hypothetical protein CDAR_531641 [Caerostris darwini]